MKHTFITVEDDMSPMGVRKCKTDSVIKVPFDDDVSSTAVHGPRATGTGRSLHGMTSVFWGLAPMAGRMDGSFYRGLQAVGGGTLQGLA